MHRMITEPEPKNTALEEGMREQMEHADGVGPRPHRHEHVAELRTVE